MDGPGHRAIDRQRPRRCRGPAAGTAAATSGRRRNHSATCAVHFKGGLGAEDVVGDDEAGEEAEKACA